MLEVLFCLVIGISDGDTLNARCGYPEAYEVIKVRIVAIDAPQRRQDYGNKSRQYLRDICYKKDAEITVYDKDRYGSYVGQVNCEGVDAGKALVENGLAWVDPQKAEYHQDLYEFQNHAQNENLNIWSMPNPVPPWEWSKDRR